MLALILNWLLQADTQPVLIPSGDEPRSRRRANRGIRIRLQKLHADGAYAGRFEDIASYFYQWKAEIVKKLDDQKGFVVLPKRWMVERALAWLSKNRRLSKDYEFQPQSSEAMIRWAAIGRMTRWLERRNT